MIDKITIENFRGILKAEVDSLALLSVLVGPNNSGKSSVLEALHLSSSEGDVGVAVDLTKRRGWAGLVCAYKLFRDPTKQISVRAFERKRENRVSLHLSEHPEPNMVEPVEREPCFRPYSSVDSHTRANRHRR